MNATSANDVKSSVIITITSTEPRRAERDAEVDELVARIVQSSGSARVGMGRMTTLSLVILP